MFYVCTNCVLGFHSVFSLLDVNHLYFSFIILLCLHAEVHASELYSSPFLIMLAKCNTCQARLCCMN